MRGHSSYDILLIAGDFEVIKQVNRALSSARFAVQSAYNHRDALYMLALGHFAAVMVDARMEDRHTGLHTLQAVAERTDVPVIALVESSSNLPAANDSSSLVFTVWEPKAIRRAVGRALGAPVDMDTDLLTDPVDDPHLTQRIEEINTLFALSKSLAEVLDLSEVLNRVVEAARNLTSAQEAMLLLPEDDELFIRARVGMEEETARNFRVKTRDTLAGQVYETGSPVLLGSNQGPTKVKTEYFVNSLVYVPVVLHGDTVGVLGVSNRTGDVFFSKHHERLLLNLASFAAVAIENARVHEENQARTRALELLVKSSERLNASLELDKALSNITKQLASALQVDFVEIAAWDEANNQLKTNARFYRSWWPVGRGPLIELDQYPELQSVVAADRNSKRAAWITGGAEVSRLLAENEAQSMLVAPVFADMQPLGVLHAYFVHEPDVTPDDVVRQQVSSAARQGVVDLLNSSRRGLSGNVERLVDSIRSISGADWCDLSMPFSQNKALSVMVRVGEAAWLTTARPSLALHDASSVEKIQSGKPFSYKVGDSWVPVTRQKDLQAALFVPMIRHNKVVGLVTFASITSSRNYTEREVILAQALVGQSTIALENARLVHDLESSLHELQTAQKRLVQTARLSAMGELASVVAHQMNNPLTTIIVDTELMLLDEPEDSPRRDSLLAIARTGKRAANVARRLLAIARPPEAENPSDYIDVLDSLRGIISLLQIHFEHAAIQLEVNLPDETIPPVRAVKGRIDDIWLNLLMNSYDALHDRDNGVINVSVNYDADAGFVMVEVLDNGVGIAPDIQDKIFSPFFTTKPVGEGTGLGLHISREMVENAGGEISVESEPGKYSRFTVKLPVHLAR